MIESLKRVSDIFIVYLIFVIVMCIAEKTNIIG